MLPTLLLALALSNPAPGAQKSADIDKGAPRWSFDVRWDDAEGQAHQARFELPARDVRADLDEPLRFRKQEALQYVAGEIRDWASSRKGPKVTARVGNGGVQIRAKGKSRAKIKQALAEAEQVQDQALERYLDEHGFIMLDDVIAPDHLRHVQDYADDLAPLVDALGGPGDDPRTFADRALGFVQSIPYERASKKRDRYRRPLSVLGRNKGDCDSKSTLFLALMHHAWPELELGMVYIPGHAFVALGIEPERGDAKLREDGQTWLLAEPVGPAMNPAGQVGRKSRRRARWGRVDLRALE